jgi:hypothetical protein
MGCTGSTPAFGLQITAEDFKACGNPATSKQVNQVHNFAVGRAEQNQFMNSDGPMWAYVLLEDDLRQRALVYVTPQRVYACPTDRGSCMDPHTEDGYRTIHFLSLKKITIDASGVFTLDSVVQGVPPLRIQPVTQAAELLGAVRKGMVRHFFTSPPQCWPLLVIDPPRPELIQAWSAPPAGRRLPPPPDWDDGFSQHLAEFLNVAFDRCTPVPADKVQAFRVNTPFAGRATSVCAGADGQPCDERLVWAVCMAARFNTSVTKVPHCAHCAHCAHCCHACSIH